MDRLNHIQKQLFLIQNTADFSSLALEVFRLQAEHVPVYRSYLKTLGINPEHVREMEDIPFLPIEFFKSQTVLWEQVQPQATFISSGTTGVQPSIHYVPDVHLYEASFRKGFECFYGNIKKYHVLAMLPSYMEREGSSLIYMVSDLIKRSGSIHSGFFLHDTHLLAEKLEALTGQNERTILLMGVSFALLDFAEYYTLRLSNAIVMETGGMKGRRKEMVREELHAVLRKQLGVAQIHSEYGMTELLSQAYSQGNGLFRCPPWMKVLIRDPQDPLSILSGEASGGINVIDLANLYSCAFIATQDLGKMCGDGVFEILGRFDQSELRGCNLLVV